MADEAAPAARIPIGLLGYLPPVSPLVVLDHPWVCLEGCCVAVADPGIRPPLSAMHLASRPMYQVLPDDADAGDACWAESAADAMRVTPGCWDDPLFAPL